MERSEDWRGDPASKIRQSNARLCSFCWSNVFDTLEWERVCTDEEGYELKYTRSYRGIPPSVIEQCDWCTFILGEARSVHNKEADIEIAIALSSKDDTYAGKFTPVGRNVVRMDIRSGGSWSIIQLFMHTDASDPAAKFVTARAVESQVTSDSAILQCRDWLATCASSHAGCTKRIPRPMPTRVIDVGLAEGPLCPRLHETNGQLGEYITLSYCWGSNQTGVLLSSNIHQYRDSIDPNDLGQTIIDAILLTRRLGFRYIWIDAMCIVQDSIHDKDIEVSRMREIYQHSTLTIVAASSSAASEGFLANRPEGVDFEVMIEKLTEKAMERMRGTSVTDEQSPELLTPATLTRLPFRLSGGCLGSVLVRKDHYLGDIVEPMNARAWTLQEQILSCRLLVYSSATLHWRCKEKAVNLGDSLSVFDYPYASIKPFVAATFFDRTHLGGTGEDASKQITVHSEGASNEWGTIVYQYTVRHASRPEDKLPALGGIAQEFSALNLGSYLAGLWEYDICSRLEWEVPGEFIRRPLRYRAPSWSWAAVDGPVIFPVYAGATWNQIAELLDHQISHNVLHWPFGEVSAGLIRVKALALSGHIVFNTDPESDDIPEENSFWNIRGSPIIILESNGQRNVTKTERKKNPTQGETLDTKNPLRPSLDFLSECATGQRVRCLALTHWDPDTDKSTMSGLLVSLDSSTKTANGAEDQFRRVGTFADASPSLFAGIEPEAIVLI